MDWKSRISNIKIEPEKRTFFAKFWGNLNRVVYKKYFLVKPELHFYKRVIFMREDHVWLQD